MSFQQLIAGKVKLNGLEGLRRHLQERERVKTNPNIDLSRSHLNYCIEDLAPDHLSRRVKERIAQLHLKKRPRSDAVGIEDIIVSASVDFMLQLDCDTREQYFRDSLHFFQRRYGKENVMYCQCHLDESNPHIHIGVVPITSDGRLSAKSLFCPKTLEQLQTDFHREVSQSYGLERGEHHAKKYLPLQQFKAQQAKIKAQLFADDLHMADINRQKIKEADQAAHFPSKGLIFTSEDRDNIELPINHYLYLKETSEESAKMAITIHSLQDDNRQLKHDEFQARSDLNYFLRQLKELEKETALYSAIPKAWRKRIDLEIFKLQKIFSAYCHDLNRATIRTFAPLFALSLPLKATSTVLNAFYTISSSALMLKTLTNIFATLFMLPFFNTRKTFSRSFRHRRGNRLSRRRLTTKSPTKLALFLCNFLAFLTSTGT